MNLILTKISTFILNIGTMLADDLDLAEGWEWVQNVVDAIDVVLYPLLVIVASAGTIYSVVIGVNMARADSAEQREESKKKLINVIIGLVVIIALILFFKLFVTSILPGFIGTGAESAVTTA